MKLKSEINPASFFLHFYDIRTICRLSFRLSNVSNCFRNRKKFPGSEFGYTENTFVCFRFDTCSEITIILRNYPNVPAIYPNTTGLYIITMKQINKEERIL